MTGTAGASRHGRRGQRRGAARAGGRAGRDPDRRGRRTRSHAARSGRASRAAGRSRGRRSRSPPTACSRSSRVRRLRAAARRPARRAERGARPVRAAFDEAVSTRRCRLVTVLGPPGIGKSRLARELVRGARAATPPSSRAAACRTARASRSGRWSRSSARPGPEDELEAALSATRRRRSSGRSARRSSSAPASGRSRSSSRTSTGRSRPSSICRAPRRLDAGRAVLLLCLARPELLDERPAWGGEVIDARAALASASPRS